MQNVILVYWQDPEKRQRHKVGIITRENKESYTFSYSEEAARLRNEGFEEIFPFTDMNLVYRSDRLFSAFTCRLPEKRRPDIQKVLDKYNILEYDEFDLLRKSGGRSPLDTLEFIEPIDITQRPIERTFYVSGVRHCDLCNGKKCALTDIKLGDQIDVVREPENKFDKNAVVLLFDNCKLGYVPAFHSKEVSQSIEKHLNINCSVVQKNYRKAELQFTDCCCRECLSVKIIIW